MRCQAVISRVSPMNIYFELSKQNFIVYLSGARQRLKQNIMNDFWKTTVEIV